MTVIKRHTPESIRTFALEQFATHALSDVEFAISPHLDDALGMFTFNHDTSTMRIDIAHDHLTTGAAEFVEDTVLHEIAHALQWNREHKMSHDESWAHEAKTLGATPEAEANTLDLVFTGQKTPDPFHSHTLGRTITPGDHVTYNGTTFHVDALAGATLEVTRDDGVPCTLLLAMVNSLDAQGMARSTIVSA